jgi:hypothetical protein
MTYYYKSFKEYKQAIADNKTACENWAKKAESADSAREKAFFKEKFNLANCRSFVFVPTMYDVITAPFDEREERALKIKEVLMYLDHIKDIPHCNFNYNGWDDIPDEFLWGMADIEKNEEEGFWLFPDGKMLSTCDLEYINSLTPKLVLYLFRKELERLKLNRK